MPLGMIDIFSLNLLIPLRVLSFVQQATSGPGAGAMADNAGRFLMKWISCGYVLIISSMDQVMDCLAS